MCLSVYLGTNTPLDIPRDIELGSLGIELSAFTPPPLRRNHQFTYYLGRKGDGAKLECSCMLMEHVDWTEDGPVVSVDQLYPADGPCPFETLKSYCAAATAGGRYATIVCDDAGGVDIGSTEADYCTGELVRLEHIAREHLLFADASGGFPWRAVHVVNAIS
jgi:hypothetical protein